MASINLKHKLDLHIHSSPSLFIRLLDDLQVAKLAKDAGLEAIMLKEHSENTVSRARFLEEQIDGIKVFGGVVLNNYVGGINPELVKDILEQGGKQIWMPTVDSAFQATQIASGGNLKKIFGLPSMKEKSSTLKEEATTQIKKISILKNGVLTETVKRVVELVAQYDVILGTSHLSEEEIFKLTEFATKKGVQKILITHPYFWIPGLSLNSIKKLTQLGAFLEFCALNIFPPDPSTTIDKIIEAINTVGVEKCIITSDGGQLFAPLPTETLRVYAQCLHEKGMKVNDLEIMMTEIPRWLLGL